jgi:hypothetical protein
MQSFDFLESLPLMVSLNPGKVFHPLEEEQNKNELVVDAILIRSAASSRCRVPPRDSY